MQSSSKVVDSKFSIQYLLNICKARQYTNCFFHLCDCYVTQSWLFFQSEFQSEVVNNSKVICAFMFKYTCFVYGLLSLLSIGLNSSSKNNFLRKFCFLYGKCHNCIIILQLFLLENQITSENFKYCKEGSEDDSAEN